MLPFSLVLDLKKELWMKLDSLSQSFIPVQIECMNIWMVILSQGKKMIKEVERRLGNSSRFSLLCFRPKP